MLRIGYIRLVDATGGEAEALRALGCQVVRLEEHEGAAQPVLSSILDFIGEGDELVAPGLRHLGRSARGLLDVLDRLEGRGASLLAADPGVASLGAEGRALRAALEAVAAFERLTPARRSRAPTHEIRALQRAGLGPVEIARRLGVSRMTVWRKLKALDA